MKKIILLLLAVTLLAIVSAAAAENLNESFRATFSASPAVFSGPGRTYWRANNGKAQYGSGGGALVFGRTQNWIMIYYETGKASGSVGRIGFISYDNINKMNTSYYGEIKWLNFEHTTAWASRTVDITDDPVKYAKAYWTVPKDTELTYLADYRTDLGHWAYVEVYLPESGQNARGFIPYSDVSFSYPGSGSSGQYVSPQTGSTGVWARANQRLATRSGPSTRYEDTGTYFLQDMDVLVLSKHYDSYNGIWWVKCRIEDRGAYRYLWTGVKRFYDQDWLLSVLPTE